MLKFSDFEGMTDEEVISELEGYYQEGLKNVSLFEVLVASQDTYDYEGSSYLLLKHKKTGELFENYSSHCSCDSFYFSPTTTTVKYLLSDLFNTILDQNRRKQIQDLVRSLYAP